MSENLDEEVKSSVLDLKHETGNRELVNGFSRSRSFLIMKKRLFNAEVFRDLD